VLGLALGKKRLLGDAKLLGKWGEKRAAAFLTGKGFMVIARNYTCPAGEIDLISSDPDGAIVFVEVKTRRDELYAKAQDAVTAKKQRTMTQAAKSFIRNYKIKDKPLRFDVVAVVLGKKGKPQIRHYENAFTP
jgi:putative endonuclease